MTKHKKKLDYRALFQHVPHYIPLVGIMAAGALAFFVFSYDKKFQAGVVVSVAIGHVTWGIVHHHIHGDLSLGIVLEYLAIAALGTAVVLSLIFGS